MLSLSVDWEFHLFTRLHYIVGLDGTGHILSGDLSQNDSVRVLQVVYQIGQWSGCWHESLRESSRLENRISSGLVFEKYICGNV